MNADGIVHPFGQKINSRFAAMPDVGADVQKIIVRDWLQQPGGEYTTAEGSHAAHREGDERDVSFTVAEIEFKKHVTLQQCSRDFVMDEDGTQPIGEQERLAFDRQEALSRGCTEAGCGLSCSFD